MGISFEGSGDSLALHLSGRLDAGNAPELGAAVEQAQTLNLQIDLRDCNYVSSAGLREFLRAHRRQQDLGGTLRLVNVPASIVSVLELTGFLKLLHVQAQPREISVDGLEFLSAGVCGEVFRLDEETIVKLYKSGLPPSVAEREKEYARAAFVAGIPTAISYEVVSSGDRLGVVYEMLEARQLSALIRESPEKLEHFAARYAGIVRDIHAIAADPDVFPDLKQQMRDTLDQSRQWLNSDDVDLLLQRLENIPDASNFVHFDIHTSNIMLRGEEPLIIDMGDVSRGSGLFDLGLVRTIFGYPQLGICQVVTGIPNELGARLWDSFCDHYFAGRTPEREFFERHQHFLASLRGIYTLCWFPELRERLLRQVHEVFLPLIRQEVDAEAQR